MSPIKYFEKHLKPNSNDVCRVAVGSEYTNIDLWQPSDFCSSPGSKSSITCYLSPFSGTGMLKHPDDQTTSFCVANNIVIDTNKFDTQHKGPEVWRNYSRPTTICSSKPALVSNEKRCHSGTVPKDCKMESIMAAVQCWRLAVGRIRNCQGFYMGC